MMMKSNLSGSAHWLLTLVLVLSLLGAPAEAQSGECGECPSVVAAPAHFQQFPHCMGGQDWKDMTMDEVMAMPCILDLEPPQEPARQGSRAPLGKAPPESCLKCLYECHEVMIAMEVEGHPPMQCPTPPPGCTGVASFQLNGISCDENDGNSNRPEGAKDPDGDGMPSIWDVTPNGKPGPGNPGAGLNNSGVVPNSVLDDPQAFASWLENETGVDLAGDLDAMEDFLNTMGVNMPDFTGSDSNGDGLTQFGEVVNQLMDLVQIGGALIQQGTEAGGQLRDLDDAMNAFAGLSGLADATATLVQLTFPDAVQTYNALRGIAMQAGANLETITEFKAELEIQMGQNLMIAAVVSWGLDQLGHFAGQIIDSLGSMGIDFDLLNFFGVSVSSPDSAGNDQFKNGPPGLDSTTGDPVDTRNGSFVYEVQDLFLPGRGMDLELRRLYRSKSWRVGIGGRNWYFPLLETHIKVWPPHEDSPRPLTLSWGRGYEAVFLADANVEGLYNGMGNEFGKIADDRGQFQALQGCESYPETQPAQDSFRGFVYRKPDGTLYFFCPPSWLHGAGELGISYLRKIVDPEGNQIVFHRNSWGGVTEIIDTLGRSTQLAYDETRQLLKTITDPEGRKTDYVYDHDLVIHTQGTDPLPSKFQLARVDYPSTAFFDAGAQVMDQDRPFEEYAYSSTPEGYYVNPDPSINHNLLSITGPQGEKVGVIYHTTQDYQFDKVASHTVAGKTTTFRYEVVTADPLGNTDIKHKTVARYPDGAIKVFHHGNGLLLREEIWNGKFDSQEQLLPGTQDPNSPSSWMTLYEYNEDLLLTARTETTSDTYPNGRKTSWIYDEDNVDRSRQANVLGLVKEKDPLGSGPALIQTSFTYDPIRNKPNSATDTLGRTTRMVFGHQELDYADILDLDIVAPFHILPADVASEPAWGAGDVGLDDINGDSVRGLTTKVIQKIHPAVDIADPAGLAAAASMTLDEMTQFNAAGQMIASRDLSGTWTTIQYGSHGFPVSRIADPAGLAVREDYVYDTAGRLLETYRPDGSKVSLTYDNRELVTESRMIPPSNPSAGPGRQGIQPTAHVQVIRERMFYDLAGRLIAQSHPREGDSGMGSSIPPLDVLFEYDAVDNPTKITRKVFGPNGNLLRQGDWLQEYDGNSRLIRTESPLGGIVTVDRNSRGLAVGIARSGISATDFGETRIQYNAYQEPVTVEMPVDSDEDQVPDTLSLVYDGHGRQLETISASGVREIFLIADNGRVEQIEKKDPSGNTIFLEIREYDNWDRPTRSSVQNFTLHHDGSVTSATAPAWFVTEQGYGQHPTELLWTKIDPAGENRILRFQYDSLHRKVGTWRGYSTHAPSLQVGVLVQRDALGRPVMETFIHDLEGRSGSVNPSQSSIQRSFGPFGPEVVIDAAGKATYHSYDVRGRLVKTIRPDGGATHFTYNSAGQLRKTRRVGGNGPDRITRQRFDLLGNLTKVIDEQSNRTRFLYDEQGRMESMIYPDGMEVRYVRDAANRLLQEIQDFGGSEEVTLTRSYSPEGWVESLTTSGSSAVSHVSRTMTYSPLGHPVSVQEQVGTGALLDVQMDHSSLDLVVKENLTDGGGNFLFTSAISYDAGGLVDLLDYPSGLQVDPEYDSLGRIQSISTSDGLLVDFTPYGEDRYRQSTHAEGGNEAFTHQREFDVRGLLTRQELLSSQSGLIEHGFQYGYDRVGNLISRTSLPGNLAESFSYDGFDQLARWDYGLQSGVSPDRTVVWDYDLAGNFTRIEDQGSVSTPQANALNQYEDFSPQWDPIQYNQRGGETMRSESQGNRYMTWDALGRATSLTRMGPGGESLLFEFLYDGLDRLIQWTQKTNGTITSVSQYQYLGDRIIEIRRPTETLELVYGFDGQEILSRRSGTGNLHFFMDPFENTTALFSTVIEESYSYDPFGRVQVRDGQGNSLASSGVNNELQWLGRPFLKKADLIHLQARFYDPALGRFLSRDPLGLEGGINLYQYARNNPFRWKDPEGLSPRDIQNPTPGTSEFDDWSVEKGQARSDAIKETIEHHMPETPLLDKILKENPGWSDFKSISDSPLERFGQLMKYGRDFLNDAARTVFGEDFDDLSRADRAALVSDLHREIGSLASYAAHVEELWPGFGGSLVSTANGNMTDAIDLYAGRVDWREGRNNIANVGLGVMAGMIVLPAIAGSGAIGAVGGAIRTGAQVVGRAVGAGFRYVQGWYYHATILLGRYLDTGMRDTPGGKRLESKAIKLVLNKVAAIIDIFF